MAKDLDLWFLLACLGVGSLLLSGCGAGGVKMTKVTFMDDGLPAGTVPVCIITCANEDERDKVLQQLDPDKLAVEPRTEGGESWRDYFKSWNRYKYVPFSRGQSETEVKREGNITLVIMADFPEPLKTFPSGVVGASKDDQPNRVVIQKPGKEHVIKVGDNYMYRSE